MSDEHESLGELKEQERYDFTTEIEYAHTSRRGLGEDVVRQVSAYKGEPDWMLEFRLKALEVFNRMPMPAWGADLGRLDFEEFYYYMRATPENARTWEDVPDAIKETFEKLGIPEAERKYLAGVETQMDSESVYSSLKEEWERHGIIFVDMDTAVRKYPELVREHISKVVPIGDNKFAALNSAFWSGGSFVYVPAGVQVEIPLQAYFRINAQSLGQFERTIIIAEEGSSVHYIEGCTAPQYTTAALHTGVIEIFVKRGARARYTTIQNWSRNVYNLVTQRAMVWEDGAMYWVDGNLGCLAEGATVTTPAGLCPIESLEVGEQILSFDEATGQFVFRKVLAKRFSGHQRVREVSCGERRLRVTDNHPFYSYVYMPDRPKKLGRYELAFVRADRLTQAIIPCRSMDLGLPYPLQYPQVKTPHTSPRRRIGRSNIQLPETVEVVDVTVGESSPEAVPTWDIEVEGTGNFVSEGFIVHNSGITMKYPAVVLRGERAHGEVLSIAFAGRDQYFDAGAKAIHLAPNTTSRITSKSISKDNGRADYRGLIRVNPGATGAHSKVQCDALLISPESQTSTYPYMDVQEDEVWIEHEATVSKISQDQLFYLMSRGLSEEQASAIIVNGFLEPFIKELPMEYAVELNRLIALQMEGGVG